VKQDYLVVPKTTLRISDDIIKQLKHIAIDENKTLTQIIQEALTEYLKKKNKKF
jgi:predicted transcriptional regulator